MENWTREEFDRAMAEAWVRALDFQNKKRAQVLAVAVRENTGKEN